MEINKGLKIKTDRNEVPTIGNTLKWSLVAVQLTSVILLSAHFYFVSSSRMFFDSFFIQKVLNLFYGYQLMTVCGFILMVIFFHKKKFVLIRNAFLIFGSIRLLILVEFFLFGISTGKDFSLSGLQLLKMLEIVYYITIIVHHSRVGHILKIYAVLSLVVCVADSWFSMLGRFEFAFITAYGYLLMMALLLLYFFFEPVSGRHQNDNLLDDFPR